MVEMMTTTTPPLLQKSIGHEQATEVCDQGFKYAGWQTFLAGIFVVFLYDW